MSATKLISLLAASVAEGMKREKSIVDAGRASAWVDYRDEVVSGPTGAEQLFRSFIRQMLRFELRKLPQFLVVGLWWHTEAADGTFFEARYAYENGERVEAAIHQPTESEQFEGIAGAVVARLNEMAEADDDDEGEHDQHDEDQEEEKRE